MCSTGWTSVSHPSVRRSKASTSGPVGDPDLCRDVGTTVIVIIDVVVNANGAESKQHLEIHVDRARQPDLRKCLKHGHVGADIGQPGEPLSGKKVPTEIVERVFQDLMRGRLDPERHL